MITLQERVHNFRPPESWALKKLHRCLRVRRGFKNAGMIERNLLSLSYGKIVPKNINGAGGLLPESFETYQIVEPGNIVLRLTDLQNDKRSLRQGLVKERGIITSAYDSIEVEKKHDPRFWFYTLLSLDLAKYYYSLGAGVRQSIKFSDFPNDWVAVPPPSIQFNLANFLEFELASIDKLIALKQRAMKLAASRVNALIDNAISNPETSWVRFENVATRVERLVELSEGRELVRLGLYNKGRGLFKKPPADKDGMGASSFHTVKLDDLILSGQFAWEGSVAMITEDERECVVSHRYPIYRGKKGVSTAYLLGFLRSGYGNFLLNESSRGSAGRNRPLNTARLEKEKIPIASDELQQRVEDALSFERKLKQDSKKSIALLLEKRISLITETVTGQLDISKIGRTVFTSDNDVPVLIAAHIINSNRNTQRFGRVKLQKIIYLAETHAGIFELNGQYDREAAGPLDRGQLRTVETALETEGFYNVSVDPEGGATRYYSIDAPQSLAERIRACIGERADVFFSVVDKLREMETKSVEAISTLYAVWNDALIDGETPDDARIIRGVLEEWHPEKKDKFRPDELQNWLGWMRRNEIVPKGQGPKTSTGRLFV